MQNFKSTQNKSVIFLHMPKTAGTSFYDAIKCQYRKGEIFSCQGIPENAIQQFNVLPAAKQKEIKFFKGHMTFGLHQFLPAPYTYITILRHPTKRIISLYYYLLQSTSHKQHYLVSGKTLHEFAQQKLCHHNFQTRYIAGLEAFNLDCSDDDKLEMAKENIDKHFAAVGIQEYFDESLIVFKRKLNWSNMPLYIKQNKSKKPISVVHKESTLEFIQEKNSLDIQIYEYAKSKLLQQINQLGSDFDQELKNFKFMNRAYSPIGNIYSLSRSLFIKLFIHKSSLNNT